ncbi:PREDICTED: uncharacterized protein LOC106147857 [Chinchilla lanigera]|uniref:uncharacterized protein LOC106147857 n=1 Tax=Chinchilla lanigera TaxID=34839 RepID=UPI0006971486|nr:PREDICTED: uncharacterized protein LOC106147857 [Chinchilla lanigera]
MALDSRYACQPSLLSNVATCTVCSHSKSCCVTRGAQSGPAALGRESAAGQGGGIREVLEAPRKQKLAGRGLQAKVGSGGDSSYLSKLVCLQACFAINFLLVQQLSGALKAFCLCSLVMICLKHSLQILRALDIVCYCFSLERVPSIAVAIPRQPKMSHSSSGGGAEPGIWLGSATGRVMQQPSLAGLGCRRAIIPDKGSQLSLRRTPQAWQGERVRFAWLDPLSRISLNLHRNLQAQRGPALRGEPRATSPARRVQSRDESGRRQRALLGRARRNCC